MYVCMQLYNLQPGAAEPGAGAMGALAHLIVKFRELAPPSPLPQNYTPKKVRVRVWAWGYISVQQQLQQHCKTRSRFSYKQRIEL